ncbi:MAG: GYD domain-containing protein [Planctomycetales bacterium]|nr:GYD domain-containing protein [Planctomycetales bacterium]NIM10320.1 GYD domain-containing protein [Planctomycetales bacterium]NIN09767.1 GYD domain-containing protein [Planctomycetales bacterium]NIN78890.1 GYD domain-containing protein [Planctomycetales bacterium]NIO36061.1 GYD domain-containing protein [Planctomycetales bacterium]
MNKFFLLGKYSSDAIQKMSGRRTQQARQLIEELGGQTREIYALLGEHDLIFIVEFERMTDAMKASMALSKMTGISFSTAAAIPVEEFDAMLDEL